MAEGGVWQELRFSFLKKTSDTSFLPNGMNNFLKLLNTILTSSSCIFLTPLLALTAT